MDYCSLLIFTVDVLFPDKCLKYGQNFGRYTLEILSILKCALQNICFCYGFHYIKAQNSLLFICTAPADLVGADMKVRTAQT